MQVTAVKHKAEPTGRMAPLYKVLLHDDPISTAAFVVQVIVTVFRKAEEEAYLIMMEAHESAVALVEVMSLEQAELRVEMAHSFAQTAKYPLRFSIEPD